VPTSATAHYESLLADHYTWMVGDYDTTVDAQRALLSRLGIPHVDSSGAARALDLGSGSGFQALALAELGYAVVAIDTSAKLLGELEAHRGDHTITTVLGDIRNIRALGDVRFEDGFDVVLCMGDTLTHLETRDEVDRLLTDACAGLRPGGSFIVTFRDLTTELTGLDRFIPVRADDDRILTCFLESDRARADTVVVHDLLYQRRDAVWTLRTSAYRKLRISPTWLGERLVAAGFAAVRQEPAGRLVAMIATR
jgi:SAM-dependent methyltransferase